MILERIGYAAARQYGRSSENYQKVSVMIVVFELHFL